jgi:hypothetical protein
MSGTETADIRPQALDQGRLSSDSESVEDLPSLLSHVALQVPRFLLDQSSSVLQEHNIITTEYAPALLPYDPKSRAFRKTRN